MALGAADVGEDLLPPLRGTIQILRLGRRQGTDVGVGVRHQYRAHLGLGQGVHTRRNRLAANRALAEKVRYRHTLLDVERPFIELGQRGGERLPAEPADSAIEEPVHSSRHAITVAVVRIGESEDRGFRNGIEQSEPEQVRRRSLSSGRLRRNRLRIDPQRGLERWGDRKLEDRSAPVRQRVAEAVRTEHASIQLGERSAAPRHRLVVASGAALVVEERAQPCFRGEFLIEDDAALLEPIALVTGETVERVTRLRRPVTAYRPKKTCQENYRSDPLCWAAHGHLISVESRSSSIRSAWLPWGVFRY